MSRIVVPYFMGERRPFGAGVGGVVVPGPGLPDAAPQERMAVLYRNLAGRVALDEQPVVVAGDCVAVIGVLAGLQRRGIDASVVWFDAHGDFHTWETTRSGFLGGMPLAMLTGRGEQTVVAGAGLRPVPDERVVLVDGRDLDPGEDAALAASGVLQVAVGEAAAAAPPGPLLVHFDVDVVDPTEMPAVDYPAPGGPSLAEVDGAMAALAATGRVAAFTISAWNPGLSGAEASASASLAVAARFEA